MLTERKKKLFVSLQEMMQRVKSFPDPVKVITKRVVEELSKDEKYHLFIKPKRIEKAAY